MGELNAARELLAREFARRDQSFATELVWHGVGAVLVFAAASGMFLDAAISSEVRDDWSVSFLTCIAYIATWAASHRMLQFPVAHSERLILANVSITLFVIAGVLTLGAWQYSQGFLLAAVATGVVWQLLGLRLVGKPTVRLALVPGPIAESLQQVRHVHWQLLTQPVGLVRAKGVVIDREVAKGAEWQRFLTRCALNGVPAYDACAVYEAMTGKVHIDPSWPNALDERAPADSVYTLIKHYLDAIVVLLLLPIILPVFAVISLAIWLESPGPVLFWQDRVGQAGKVFRMVKFRTMRVSEIGDGPQFAVAENHRITRFGRLLRRYRLDELPQLWNVLRGEMSIVGPRPEQVPFAAAFAREIPLYDYRHLVRPGITGWAQVNHGYAAGREETQTKLAYDLYYIKHRSFWLDVLIALRTPRTIISRFGAR